MSDRGEIWPMGHARRRFRAPWVVALIACLVLGVILVGGSAPAAASHKGGGGPSPFAALPGANAVSATPTALLAMSESDCSTVYSISAAGQTSTFATLPGAASHCPEQAIAVSPGLGNFVAGTVYVLQGSNLYEISPDGRTVTLLPGLSQLNGGSYAGLTFDYAGSFGYGLLAVGSSHGNVVAIDAAGNVQNVGAFGTSVDGPAVAPIGFGTGGDLGGYLVAAAGGHSSSVYAMNPTTGVPQPVTSWNYAEAVSFVPTLSCTFSTTGDAYFVADSSSNGGILAFASSSFTSVVGDGLVVAETHNGGVGLFDGSPATATASSFLPLSGTFEGSSYVACPVGVSQSINLNTQGSITSHPDVLGYNPADSQLIANDLSAPGSIVVLNGITGAFVADEPLTDASAVPTGVAYNPQANELYVIYDVPGQTVGELAVLDATNYAVLDTVPTGPAPVAVAFNVQTEKLYVANSGDDTITLYSISNNNFPNQNQVQVLDGTPVALVVDPIDSNVYAVGNGTGGTGTLWMFHVFQYIGEVQFGSDAGGAGGIAVNTASGQLYVTSPSFAYPSSGAVIACSLGPSNTLPACGQLVPDSNEPVGIAYNAFDGRLFVANWGDATLWIIGGGHVIATVMIGSVAGSLVYDPANHLVYVAADVSSNFVDPRIILGTSG